ncbi:AraC family transcriptional regulator [Cloacibacterium rupense]|nr:AraC family transcriptional regulator [Cloacibacterium rupense]
MRTIMNEKLPISSSIPIKARHYDYQHFTYPWHFHSQYELMFVKEGFGQCFVGDTIHQFSDGDLILFGNNLPHYMNSDDSYKKKDSKLRVKGTIIQFEKDFMSYSINNYPQFLQIKNLLEISGRGVLYTKENSEKIIETLQKLPEMEGLQQVTNLLTILQELATCKKKTILATPHFYKSFPKLGDNRIEKIISYININYTRNISLVEIASLAAMNASSFCRYFKEQTGKTFTEYIMDMRIGYACKLLTLGEKSINQISIECGFESITHFNRMFKRHTKFTPTLYRQKILENI